MDMNVFGRIPSEWSFAVHVLVYVVVVVIGQRMKLGCDRLGLDSAQ